MLHYGTHSFHFYFEKIIYEGHKISRYYILEISKQIEYVIRKICSAAAGKIVVVLIVEYGADTTL